MCPFVWGIFYIYLLTIFVNMTSAPKAVLRFLLLAAANAQVLEWGSQGGSFLGSPSGCNANGGLRILDSRTYCCDINAFATHCLAVLDLEGGKSAIVEQSGLKALLDNGENQAHIECHFHPGKVETADLPRYSWNFQQGTKKGYSVKLQQPAKVAASFIGAYNSVGLVGAGWKNSPQYPMTLGGLKRWSQAYLNDFPAYRTLSWNCQKYSVGVYNAVTHSSKWEKQAVLTGIGKPFAPAIEGSARFSSGQGDK